MAELCDTPCCTTKDVASAAPSPLTESPLPPRTLGRWFIAETLGKGTYSWVKRGYDRKTGRSVALKFSSKADESWASIQQKQVSVEIEALKRVRHKHVLRLLAFNRTCKYPRRDGGTTDTVLLVLEYAPGGELFDILYYTSALEPIIARTYFRQLVDGLEACHSAGVCHRDLKPQNLLLDRNFRLKIADFGLAKVFKKSEMTTTTTAPRLSADSGDDSSGETLMTTSFVGTRGYKAPELILGVPFDNKCDVFSCAVILFVLLTGYPPFDTADKRDRWYRPLAKGTPEAFWALHAGSLVSEDLSVQELLTGMLHYNPETRWSLKQVQAHAWFQGKHLSSRKDILIRVLTKRHKKMESMRRKDALKRMDLLTSEARRFTDESVARAIKPPLDAACAKDVEDELELFPAHEVEGIWDIYTTTDWRQVLNTVNEVVLAHEGVAEFNAERKILNCTIRLVAEDESEFLSVVKFSVAIFRSRRYQGLSEISSPSSDGERLLERSVSTSSSSSSSSITSPRRCICEALRAEDCEREPILAVRVRRTNGDVLDFRKIVNNLLFPKCAHVLTGLPRWARRKREPWASEEDMEDSDDDLAADVWDDAAMQCYL